MALRPRPQRVDTGALKGERPLAYVIASYGVAQHAADNGADIGTIQTLLGHKSPAKARRYAGEAMHRQGARPMVQ